MKIPEHITLSILLAQFGVRQEYGLSGTTLMIVAGCLPDVDGIAIVAGWRFYRRFHRILGHGVLVTLSAPLLLAGPGGAVFGWSGFPLLWLWLQVSLLGHLITDVAFYDWPVQLLWPFSRRGWAFGLVTWNDLVPTSVLYAATIVVVCRPALAMPASGIGIGALVLYLLWRAVQPRSHTGWSGWLTGGWAAQAAPVFRWLTGDFIT
ncbi:MAG: metal-dependent hydrolase [Gemmataceae bacterium]|nr:metal-dependent hydrolase [Gemmataceae bacterium]